MVPHSQAASHKQLFPALCGFLHCHAGCRPASAFAPDDFGRGSQGQIYKDLLKKDKTSKSFF